MEPKPILQIVPGFKPATDGMGDFARKLGAGLWQQDSIRSHFLAYRQPKTPLDVTEIQPNSISYPELDSPAALSAKLSEIASSFDCVLLHYGSYAYSRIGKPAEFTRTMQQLAKTKRIFVFFHETYAMGYPWKRAFWTTLEQRRCVRELLALATVAFTSNALYLRRLEGFNSARRPLVTIPIFSNIGEPDHVPDVPHRERQMIIFGQLATRNRLYKSHQQALANVCRRLRIDSVVDVGSGQSPDMPRKLANASVRSAGWMDEGQLSNLMLTSIAGAIGYWPDVWEKSGVMAAYSAHGLLPVLLELESRTVPKPPFVPYLLPADITKLGQRSGTQDGTISDETIQSFGSAAFENYRRHQSVSQAAKTIASVILG